MADFSEEDFIVICPQCDSAVWIVKINCQIFRHGAYKINGEQLPPHMSQRECEELVAANSIYGCGKPFRIVKSVDGKNVAVVCEYI